MSLKLMEGEYYMITNHYTLNVSNHFYLVRGSTCIKTSDMPKNFRFIESLFAELWAASCDCLITGDTTRIAPKDIHTIIISNR